MATRIYLLIITIILYMVPSSAFARELINNSFNLSEVLQTQESKAACDEYHSLVKEQIRGEKTAEKIRSTVPAHVRELCGKYIFVYGTPYALAAVPETYVFGAMQAWPGEAGRAFKDAGLIENPDDPGFPVGIPQVKAKNPITRVAARGPTRLPASCAMCHFSKLDDGRYSFGSGSSDIVFGKLASVFSYPLWIFDQKRDDESVWNSEVIQHFEAMKVTAEESGAPGILFPDLLKFPSWLPLTKLIRTATSLPHLGLADQRDFMSRKPGRGPAFYIALATKEELPLTVPTLWGITSPSGSKEIKKHRLGAFVHSPDLETHVMESLMILSGTSDFNTPEWIVPLSDFIRAVKRPDQLADKNIERYAKGEKVFKSRCSRCHSDSSGGSGKLFSTKYIGLVKRYSTPYMASLEPSNKTSAENFRAVREFFKNKHPEFEWNDRGVRVRRLKGVWTRKYLMSNGGVHGLDHAFCLNGRERNNPDPLTGDSAHAFLCKLSLENREALAEFLRHW